MTSTYGDGPPGVALGVDGRGQCLLVTDALAPVDRPSSNVTWSVFILPTPTQMFDGIQFQLAFGVTTTTSSDRFSIRERWSAAVWPAIPPPEDDDSCHVKPPSVCLRSAYQIP